MLLDTHKGETFAEKRAFERFPIKLNIKYAIDSNPEERTLFSHSISRNLGIGGVALLVNEKIDTGQVLQMEIDLPSVTEIFDSEEQNESLSAAQNSISMISRVVWSQAYESTQYLIGVQFLDLEQDAIASLKDFLKEYKLQDGTVDEE